MPRRRSMSIESVRVVPASTLPSSLMAPASNSRRSVRLVLPASTCARIPRLSVCKGQLLQESGRDCQRCSRRPHRSYPLEKIVTDDQLPRSPESFRNRFSMPGLKGPAKLSMSPDPFVVRLDEPKRAARGYAPRMEDDDVLDVVPDVQVRARPDRRPAARPRRAR